MKQVEIYKDALKIMKQAEISAKQDRWRCYSKVKSTGIDYYEFFSFWGLCFLIHNMCIHLTGDKTKQVMNEFKSDSEKVLNKKLDHRNFWFTDVEVDPLKAKKDRIEHLERLIKLYEDEK